MATVSGNYQTIGTYNIYNFEQEEIIETNSVAGTDGIITEVTTVIQPYLHIWVDLIAKQEILVDENKSNFLAELILYATAGEMGEGCVITPRISKGITSTSYSHLFLDNTFRTTNTYKPSGDGTKIEVAPGETISKTIGYLTTKGVETITGSTASSTSKYLRPYHHLDGSFSYIEEGIDPAEGSSSNSSTADKYSLKFNGKYYFQYTCITDGEEVTQTIKGEYSDIAPTPLANDRGLYPLTADNFTDEGNPSITYSAPTTGNSLVYYSPSNVERATIPLDSATSLQVALSLDGETIDVAYRDIPLDGASYTFDLTETERELLRQKAQGSNNVPIYYLTKTTRYIEANDTHNYPEQIADCFAKTQRILTIVGCNPSINPTVKDIKPETLALTGDENTFVRYESMAEYAINATASKHATIVSQSVQCGSKTISNLPYGVIDDVESGTFVFNVVDSRGLGVSGSVFKNLVEYVKPTCYQKLEIELSGEVDANIKLTVNGNYYNGSFGATDNTLLLEVRYIDDDGNMGEWTTITGTPTYNGNTYTIETIISGFDYGGAYIFQCRATDKLNAVESSQYTIRLLPVFDWSETDFNFNVPVNINAEELSMNGETIIRHSETTNNTVLSSSGGHIYIRPKGTDNTSGQTIMYSSGNVDFSGSVNFGSTVNFNNSFTIGGYILNDYVIETGSESMGSNGTWYWQKWLSGKAECWGCRNFGNMAVTTAWGNLYRSAIFTQDLPDGLFARTPESININIVHGGYGGWICKHEQTAPSAITTGSFIYVRPATATLTPSNLGFHIIGEWY